MLRLSHPKELLYCLRYVAENRDVSYQEFLDNAIRPCKLLCRQYRRWISRGGKRPFRLWPDYYICVTPYGRRLLDELLEWENTQGNMRKAA